MTGMVWPVDQFWQMESAIRLQFVTIETKRSLGRVNFRKGAWEKIGQQLTGTFQVTIPERIAGRILAPVPFF